MGYEERRDFSVLTDKVLKAVYRNGDDDLWFETTTGEVYRMFYDPDCCASCSIESIAGDLGDLVGVPIVLAEEATDGDVPPDRDPKDFENEESFTWTFYKLRTIKGDVTIRWFGSSNGYYSETASFEQVDRVPDSAQLAASSDGMGRPRRTKKRGTAAAPEDDGYEEAKRELELAKKLLD